MAAVVIFVLAVVVAVAALVALQAFEGGRPADHIVLAGTSWTVAAVEHSPGGSALGSVAFHSDGTADVIAPCGAFTITWEMESDGDAIGFGDVPSTPTTCPPEHFDQDRSLRRALTGTRSWTFVSLNTIELHGADVVELIRS